MKKLYKTFIAKLKASAFTGEIAIDLGTRTAFSVDNSIYQLIPRAVLFPKTQLDVVALMKLASEPEFREVCFCARGGGTSTNGQSITSGIIVDFSKHMNAILDCDPEEGWVRVQPGVVLDQLNAYLKPFGYMFAPNISTGSRATIGGMVNTDACGVGSCVYGRTSDHIHELTHVLFYGNILVTHEMPIEDLEHHIYTTHYSSKLYEGIHEVLDRHAPLIDEKFKKSTRALTGYNLGKIVDSKKTTFNLNYLLSGQEGTLGFLTEAKLKITPLPTIKRMVVVKYVSFLDAMKITRYLEEIKPTAIESIDETIIALAKSDPLFADARECFSDENGQVTGAISLIEFHGKIEKNIEASVKQLLQFLDAHLGEPGHAIAWLDVSTEAMRQRIWDVRKKSVGLLGYLPGNRKPVPFVEDTVVPPEHLPEYIEAFKAVLDEASLKYGMFGHVDAGCIHVRPALDLRQEEDQALFKTISDRVFKLLQTYGGEMWGEHGKGFKSSYVPESLGEPLFDAMCHIKALFDPHNQLNPGKVAISPGPKSFLVPLDQHLRGTRDKQVSQEDSLRFEKAMGCNGNGVCFHYDENTTMCPSYKVTRDRLHSPKGRATVLREWLRLRSNKNKRTKKRLKSLEYHTYRAMRGCLGCKACKTQCPVHVDTVQLKAMFLFEFFKHHIRPQRDVILARIEKTIYFQSKMPLFWNIMNQTLLRFFVKYQYGMAHVPIMSRHSYKRTLKKHAITLWHKNDDVDVCLLPDVFMTAMHQKIFFHCYELLTTLGLKVGVLPWIENGSMRYQLGYLNAFESLVKKNVTFLSKVTVPIIGLEPSLTLTYRHEYPLYTKKDLSHVHLLQEWLVDILPKLSGKIPQKAKGKTFYLLQHCTEASTETQSFQQWKTIFEIFDCELLPLSVGCCGMAGSYGIEAEHEVDSRKLFDMSWRPLIEKHYDALASNILATGFSCREQVKRCMGIKLRHPVEALLEG